MGQDRARAGAARRRSSRAPAARYVEAFERITGGELPALSRGGRHRPMSTATAFRFAVNVTPKAGILDPQGRAVESSLPHLGVTGVSDGPGRAAGRADASRPASEADARATVERLAGELLSNPLIEAYAVELLGATSSTDDGRRGRHPRTGCRPDGPDRRRRLPGLEPRHRRGQRAPGGRRRAGGPVARIGRPRRGRRDRPARWVRLRRLPAGRRHRPVQPGHARGGGLRRRRRPRPRDLQRLPGPDRGRAAARARSCATARSGSCRAGSRSPPSGSTRRSPARSTRAGRSGCRSPTARAAYFAEPATLDALEAARRGPVPLRPRGRDASPAARTTGRTRTARSGRSPG